jgi:hypothetical protein
MCRVTLSKSTLFLHDTTYVYICTFISRLFITTYHSATILRYQLFPKLVARASVTSACTSEKRHYCSRGILQRRIHHACLRYHVARAAMASHPMETSPTTYFTSFPYIVEKCYAKTVQTVLIEFEKKNHGPSTWTRK